VFDLLADLAIYLGTKCSDEAQRLNAKSTRWRKRGEFWSDVAKWFRLDCIKPFAEIRAERAQTK
jgi:hypothetical protein